MCRLILLGFFGFVLSSCYYGPGVSRVETNAIRRSARTLDPTPVLRERSNAFGQDLVAPALDRTLTPLIFGDDQISPTQQKELDYEENLRRQQRAMDQMDQELDELHQKRGR